MTSPDAGTIETRASRRAAHPPERVRLAASAPALLGVALATLGVVVFAHAVPGVFTIDDDNYFVNVLMLRQGRVTLANTEGLPPSRELLFFDPGPWSRTVDATPVASTAPPLYAPLALPFSFMGWRGLVALNTLAYLATTAIVFTYAGRYSRSVVTPWLAAGAFALGGFAIEYAHGVWPHALSVALCAGGVFLAGRVIENGSARLAVVAGLFLGLATGVRYQNALVLAATGAGLWLFGVRRWTTAAAFGLGVAGPLLTSAAINHARLGSWNPISKGPGYFDVPVVQESTARHLSDALAMFWARLVDFSVRPPLRGKGIDEWVTYDPVTGAHLMLGDVVQKSFLQSSPWAVLGLALFVLAWLPRSRLVTEQRPQLRLVSLVTAAVLMVFAFSGPTRHEGFVFNQRYLLELLPLLAIGFAWALDGVRLPPRALIAGAAIGACAVLLILLGTPRVGAPEELLWLARVLLLLKLPLLLAAGLAGVWALAHARPRLQPAVVWLAGASLGWGLTLHLADDVTASHRTRNENRRRTEALVRALPDRAALVTYWHERDAAGALLFDRDIVILAAVADDGADAPMLIHELLARGRRVFVLEQGFPEDVLQRAIGGFKTTPVPDTQLRLSEIARSAGL